MSPDKNLLDELRIDRAAAPRRRFPVALILTVLILGTAAAGAAWWFTRPKTPVVRTILAQAPVSGTERTLLNASGYVTARRAATVSSKVTGKVTEVLIEEGMAVEAGQILARTDSSNVEKSLQMAEAQAASARAALHETRVNIEQAERELRRITQLTKDGFASQSEFDKQEAEFNSLKARLQQQEAEVTVADRTVSMGNQELDDTIIRAPFAGIVISKDAQPGEMISPMSAGGSFTRTGICTIVDMSSLEIEVDVSESYINRVQPNQPVEATLDSYPDWRIPAKVIAIVPTADRQKATVKVRVGFEQMDPRILPDMSVKVAFRSTGEEGEAKRSLSIPKSALDEAEGRDIVWIMRDGRVERRAVTIGSEVGDEVEIAAGINNGERVVVESSDELADGAHVTEEKR